MTPSSIAHATTPLWEPAVVLPSQLIDHRRLGRIPEMRLVAAMFEDAVQSIVRNADAQRGPRRREFLDARAWLWDDTRSWPFAFGNVCDLLGLDSRAVRERLDSVVATQRANSDGPNGAKIDCAPLHRPHRLNEAGSQTGTVIELRR